MIRIVLLLLIGFHCSLSLAQPKNPENSRKIHLEIDEVTIKTLRELYDLAKWKYEDCLKIKGADCSKELSETNRAFRYYIETMNPDFAVRNQLQRLSQKANIISVGHQFFENFLAIIHTSEKPDYITIPDFTIEIDFPVDDFSRLNGMGFIASITDARFQTRLKLRRNSSQKLDSYITSRKRKVKIREGLTEHSMFMTTDCVTDFNGEVELRYEFDLESVDQIYSSIKDQYSHNKNRIKYRKVEDDDVQVLLFFEISIVDIGYREDLIGRNSLEKFEDILPVKFFVAISNKKIHDWNDMDYCVGNDCDLKTSE